MTATTTDPPAARPLAVPGGSRRRSGRRRQMSLLVTALAVLLACGVASVTVGSRFVAPEALWHSLFGGDRTSIDAVIVWQLRIPRTVLAVLTGAALAVSGAVLQGVSRNPMADPGLLGVNAGAALAVVLSIQLFGISTPAGYVTGALVGAAVVAALVVTFSSLGARGGRRGSGESGVTLVVAGMAVTALATAVIQLLSLRDSTTFDQLRVWQVGAVSGRDLGTLATAGPVLLVGAVLVVVTARGVDALALGDEAARGLGQRTGRTRVLAVAGVVALCGASVALAGPIGFVGLAVPHLARLLTGPDHRRVLALSAVLGPCLLLAADVVGRVVHPPSEVPVGVLTAVIGVPVLLVLARRRAVAR
ncbi:FecCD family ABC transporter permease [Nakamurella endophytica]|uniref:Iron ABC transporter permease n=1 Tax=Nakamurella endophytica TaxID=1748367 RepID=A0A917WF94_9ACTN|nr:iron ABC transporter permease [Nakamurella endophytica]GGL97967.1 iron ABC transporter permease [Nakamurella endophytica]